MAQNQKFPKKFQKRLSFDIGRSDESHLQITNKIQICISKTENES